MAKPFFRTAIPLNSTFTAIVSGEGEPDEQRFTAEGLFRLPDGTEDRWDDAELRAGVEERLDSPEGYTGQLDLNFADESTARVKMVVLKPNGKKLVYDETIHRTDGLDRIHILLAME